MLVVGVDIKIATVGGRRGPRGDYHLDGMVEGTHFSRIVGRARSTNPIHRHTVRNYWAPEGN